MSAAIQNPLAQSVQMIDVNISDWPVRADYQHSITLHYVTDDNVHVKLSVWYCIPLLPNTDLVN